MFSIKRLTIKIKKLLFKKINFNAYLTPENTV